MLTKLKFDINGDDFREGLTAIISVKVAEPQFEGQTKTKLGNSDIMGVVDSAVSSELSYYLEEHPKGCQDHRAEGNSCRHGPSCSQKGP